MSPNVTEKTVDGTQTHVAGSDLVPPICFQMLQERGHEFGLQLFEGQLAGVAFFAGDKLQQQLEGITIAVESMRAEISLTRQVVGKVAAQQAGKT